MTQGYSLTAIAAELGRPASWVSERLDALRNELLLQSGHFLPLTDGEYQALRDSIAEHGVQVPVVIGEHTALLDGRHRLLIAQELALDAVPAVFAQGLTSEAERQLAIALNAARRQLTRAQKRDLVASELMRDPARSDRLIASICGVTHPTVAAIRLEIAGQQQLESATTTGVTTNVKITKTPAGTTVIPETNTIVFDRAPVSAPVRKDSRGAIRTVPERPASSPPAKNLGYVTCAHGQVHSLLRNPDGSYRLRADRD